MKIIKTGNPFATMFIVRNPKTREPIEVTSAMQFSSTIINSQGKVIAECEVVVCDQSTAKGCVMLKVEQNVTAIWKPGTATGDIKLKIGTQEKNSGNYSFTIERSIT